MSLTLFKKSVTKKIKQSNVSPQMARQLKRAILDIDTTPIEELCRKGKVIRLMVEDRENLYAYRLSSSKRILFSVIGENKIVQDVVDTDIIKQHHHSHK